MLVLPDDLARSLGPDPFDALMSLSGQVFRKQPQRETSRVLIDNKAYFIKKHTGITLKECLKNIISGRLPIIGAKTEWKAIQALTALGIATTPLVGYGVRGRWPFTQRSFVLTEALDDTTSLEDYCKDWATQRPAFAEKRTLIHEVAAITRRLHREGWVHRDLYICHFLRDQHGVLHLIDLHRMIRPGFFKKRWVVKDLSALLFSSLPCGLTRNDALRFLMAYFQLPLREALKQGDSMMNPIMIRSRALYREAHRCLPIQSWMNNDTLFLPSKKGPYHKRMVIEGSEFQATQALRVLRRRRWVLRGQWRDKAVVLKLFAKEKEFEREMIAAGALREHGILAPQLIQVTRHHDLYALIYAAIDNAHPVEAISSQLMETMASLHEAGMVQQDCHRDNFFQQGERIYVLDPGGIELHFGRPIPEKQAFKNLALLYAQWPVSCDRVHLSLLSSYLKKRGWKDTDEKYAHFAAALRVIRSKALNDWLKKIFRNCSSIRVKTGFSRRYCIDREVDTLYAKTLCAHPEAYFHSGAKHLKRGDSSTVVQTTIGDRDIVIKRYNRKNLSVRFKRYFSPSKAARSWKNAHIVQSIGIATAPPFAMIENRFGPFRQESYFAAVCLPAQRLDYFLESSPPLAEMEQCAQALNKMMNILRISLCQHGDLKASNILWDGKTLYLIDVDALKLHRKAETFRQAHEADWARLLRNWPDADPFKKRLLSLNTSEGESHG